MAILYGEIDKDTKREKIHYNRGDMVASQTINDIQDTAIDAHNMATEALDKADSVFQGNGTVVSVGGREVGTLAFSSDPQQQLDTLNAKITTSSSFNAEIVDQLPTENISSSTFYLVPNSTSADDNTYSEYLYVNGKWELLGNTQVQAYDDSELRTLINNLSTSKANKSDIPTKLPTPNKLTIKVTDQTPKYFDGSEAVEVNIDLPNVDVLVDIVNGHSDTLGELELKDIELQNNIDKKQDEITDLATIRSGASAGATAVQPSTLESQVSTLQGNIDKKVNKTTTINSKPLSSNITLTASDVGALPSDTELFSGNYNDLTNKPTIPTTASQVGALPNTTKYGASLSLTMNTSTYVVTAQLKDQAGNNLGTAQTIDLPLESVVVSGSYDATNKKVILTLKDGSTIDFSVADLIDGLASQSSVDAKYEKPSTGIPKTDLASDVQTSLGKADTALQSIPSIYVTDYELNEAVSTKADQSALDNTNATLEVVSKSTESNYQNITKLTTTVTNNYSDLNSKIASNDLDITNLQNNKANTTYVDDEIERVEGLIAQGGGTAVSVGGNPVATLEFTSNPQTQIDNKIDKVSSATVNNLSMLNADGTLADSGLAKSNVVTKDGVETISGTKTFSSNHTYFTGGLDIEGNVTLKNNATLDNSTANTLKIRGSDTILLHEGSTTKGGLEVGTSSVRPYKATGYSGAYNLGGASMPFSNLYLDGDIYNDGVSLKLPTTTGTLARTDDIPDISNLASKDDIPDISIKADKVSGATANNLASLDENGNLLDSGFAVNNGTNDSFGKIPCISSAGVLEGGKYIDFHETSNDKDYSVRLQSNGSNANVVNLPSSSGTLSLQEDFIRPSSTELLYNTSTGEPGTYNFLHDIDRYNMLTFAIYATDDQAYVYVTCPVVTFKNNSGTYKLKVEDSDATTSRTMIIQYVNTTSFKITSIPDLNLRLRRIYGYRI